VVIKMNNEYVLPTDTVILSTSDLQGNIFSYNKAFLEASGYTEAEIKGKPHSILRHSDMPKEAFKDLWDTINDGRPWFGLVKNKRKNGDYYWVAANASPIFEAGRITGFVSVRYPATTEQKNLGTQLYAQLRNGSAKMPWTPSLSLDKLGLLGLVIGAIGLALPYVVSNSTGLVLGSVTTLFGFGLSLLRGYVLSRPSTLQDQAIQDLSNGIFKSPVTGHDAWTNALNLLRTRIGQNASNSQDAARDSAVLTTAMNSASTSMMVADAAFNIVSINHSLRDMFSRNGSALKSVLPHFSVANVVGSNMDIFHQNPAHQRAMVERLTAPWTGDMLVGGLHLRLTVVPIVNAGRKLGYVVEWMDRTQEVLIESRISDALDKLAVGLFDVRVDTTGLSGFTLTLSNNINKAIATLNAAVTDVVKAADALAKGDLTETVRGQYQGDLAKIKNAMNQAIGSLNQSFGEVRRQATEVAQSSSQVSEANISLSYRIQEQAAAIEQTASAMEELTAQVQQAAESAGSANQLACSSSEEVRAGAQVMGQAITAMGEIQAVSSQITGIVSLIDSIAFQTNLLALNAAVEAARAGEHGRGFAVVASEVRALAGKSADAAKDIKGLIDQTAQKIHFGTAKVQETGMMLDGIMGHFDKMVGLVAQISVNASEQAQGLEQTNQAVAEIDQAVQQGANLVQENASLAQYLGGVATSLDELVSGFKLDQYQSSKLPEDISHLPKALVVDDNLPSQKLAVALLKLNGYAVDAVSSGNQALALAKTKSYSYELVLMDLQMKDGNGFDATKTMRNAGCRAQIIAVTADKSLEHEAQRAGVDGFLVKPLRPDSLKQLLCRSVSAPHLSASKSKDEWTDF
jgi:methyl-accepting chemotaxis protein